MEPYRDAADFRPKEHGFLTDKITKNCADNEIKSRLNFSLVAIKL